MKPTFIGIGAQKCASTWLYDILHDHPEACLSSKKELDYFSNFYDYGFQWYEENFTCDGNRPVVGEVSPSYFHGLAVPERVYQYNPDMKLILFLRNPIERLISNHKHEVRVGHIAGGDISIENGIENNPSYIEQGLYSTHLERWLEYFGKESILIVLYDDLLSDNEAVAKRVYQFLGIDYTHRSKSLKERSNVSYVNRWQLLEKGKNSLRGLIRKVGLGKIWDLIGGTGLKQLYRKYNRKPSEAVIPPMKDSTKLKLHNVFNPEIKRLEKYLDRSLSSWL